jgi:hypothetical protein
MRVHAVTRLSIALFAILAATPGSAQLYKWVDERGVTNYSNQPPSDPKTAKNMRPVEDRLSVYSPDPALAQAIDDDRQNGQQRQRRVRRSKAWRISSRRSARRGSKPPLRSSRRSRPMKSVWLTDGSTATQFTVSSRTALR